MRLRSSAEKCCVAVGMRVTSHPPHRSVRGFPAYGSYLESLTAMLRLGQGWRIRGRGSHSFISLVI